MIVYWQLIIKSLSTLFSLSDIDWGNSFGILSIQPFIVISLEKLFAHIYRQYYVNPYLIFSMTPLILVLRSLVALSVNTMFDQR